MERLAYSYSRWSTAEQSKGDSKRRQREAFDRFCKSHDLMPDRSAPMIDAGRSAYKGAHLKGTGRLGKFLDAAKRGDIPPKAKARTIRHIFKWIIDGDSIATIAQRLNANSVPTIGRAKRWITSDIYDLVTNRGLLGEYQPTDHGKNVGEPIKGFYPAIIEESVFYQAQRALRLRRPTTRGRRNARRVVNLFSGLLFSHLIYTRTTVGIEQLERDTKLSCKMLGDYGTAKGVMRMYALDPLHIYTKSEHPYLVPESWKTGRGGYVSFPYNAFEDTFRYLWANWLPVEQLSPKRSRVRLRNSNKNKLS